MSIFKEGENTNSPKTDESQTSTLPETKAFDDLLNGIKNESGERKYKDPEAALNALKHSQEYIPELKSENDRLTAELETFKAQQDKLTNLESLVEKLTASKEPTAIPASTGLDEQTVAKLLEQKLTQRDQSIKETANVETVIGALQKSYGAEAEKNFYSKAEELGMSKEMFDTLARTSPKAVMKFFPETTPPPSVTTGHNSVGFTPSATQDGPLAPPEKSILAGASTKDLIAEMRRHKEAAYKKFDIK